MSTKFFAGLAIAAMLAIGQPAFAKSNHDDKGRGHHAVASARHAGGRRIVARGTSRVVASHRAFAATARPKRSIAASGRSFSVKVERGVTAGRRAGHSSGSRPSVALSGSSRFSRGSEGSGNSAYAFRSHPGWSHDQEYTWHGRRYRWFNDAWFIVDPLPYGYAGTGYETDSVTVQVQQDLAHDGYYQGPIDGVIGPGTREAIIAYQRENELPVTGTISLSLMDSLNGR